jgi:hypothetical protein
VSNTKLYYNFLNCDAYISFLLIAFCRGDSRLTAVREIGDVPVTIFKVFQPMSNTAGTHAGISIDMTKSIKDVSSRNVLL